MSRILIADDQRDVLEALRILLKGEGHQTEAVTSISGIFNALQQRDYALLMMDLNYTRDTTSGQEGLEVIPKIQALDNTLPIVVMTAWATIDLAVEAMKRGARDFVPKPWDNERLLTIVRTQIELGSALRKGRKLEAANKLLGGNVAEHDRGRAIDAAGDRNDSASRAVGRERADHRRKRHRQESDRASAARALAARIAQHDHGEHGRACRKHCSRANCSVTSKARSPTRRRDRAGRFELADESTLFMDEIANIPLNQQAKLLRVIETGEFERVGSSKTLHANVRIISATNANLADEVAAGRFRQDLLVSVEHDRDRAAAVARPARRHHAAGEQFSADARAALSQGARRLR